MKGTNVNQLNNQMVDTYDPVRASALFAIFIKNETWQVLNPNHPTCAALPRGASGGKRSALEVHAKGCSRWLGTRRRMRGSQLIPRYLPAESASSRKRWRWLVQLTGAGVKLLAGTDTPNPFCFPGFSLHDELGFLVQAGLTPLEALQTATIKPAEFLGLTKKLGTVEKGKIADLVLLGANPLEDIANTKRIAAVISAGRFLDRKALDGLLASAANVANEPTH